MRLSYLIILIATAIHIPGCAGNPLVSDNPVPPADTAPIPAGLGNPAGLLSRLPGLDELPALVSPGRQASYQEALSLFGDAAVLTSTSGATPVAGADMQLTSDPGELAWAIYEFAEFPDDAEFIDVIAVEALTLSPAGVYFLALSNYERDTWEIVSIAAPAVGPQVLADNTIRNADDYQSQETVYVAVFAFNGQSLKVDSVTLTANLHPIAPKNVEATGGVPGTEALAAITLEWDAAVGAEGYQITYRRADEPLAEFLPLVEVGSATLTFNHTQSSPAGKGAEYGVFYEYRLHSLYKGAPTFFSSFPTALGVRALPPPAQFEASDQVDFQAVYLEWTPVTGATGYDVWPDEPLNGPLVSTVQTSTTFNTQDGAEHSFFIRATCPEGDALGFTETKGSMANWFGADVQNDTEEQSHSNVVVALGAPQILAYSSGSTLHSSTVDLSGISPAPSPLALAFNAKPDGLKCQPGIAEHAGKLFISYFYDFADSTPDELRIASSSDATPDGEGDWTAYKIFDTSSADRLCLVNAGGLLYLLFRALDGNHVMHIANADVNPDAQGDWTIGPLLVPNADICSCYDMAEVAGTAAVVYELDGQLFYGWTNAADPEPADWTTTLITSDLDPGGVIWSVALAEQAGRPVVAYIDGGGFMMYATAGTGKPEADGDWQREFIDEPGGDLRAIDVCSWGADQTLVTYADSTEGRIQAYQRLDLLVGGGAAPSWLKSTSANFTDEAWPDAGLDLAVHNGRPLMVYTNSAAAFNAVRMLYLPPPEI